MNFDQPISTKDDDKLGRDSFAADVAGMLVLPKKAPGTVFGIEAGWGMGKTSVINMITEILGAHEDRPIVVRFEPWAVADFDTLVEAFLTQFAATIGRVPHSDTAQKAAKKVLTFAKFMAPVKLIPGAEPWATLVEKTCDAVGASVTHAAGQLDSETRKRRVEEALEEFGRPIVVIMDDIDRLPPAEVRTVFQVVKAIANFNRTAYLLAYDREPVAKALRYDGTYDGDAYLEKIVQAAMPLPRIHYAQKKDFFLSAVESFLKRNGLELENFENERVADALAGGAALTQIVRHPRDIYRILNKCRLPATRTRGEVNFADILAYETLAVRYPRAAKSISQNPSRFSTGRGDEELSYAHFRRGDEEAKRKIGEGLPSDLVEGLSPEDTIDLEAVLGFLFPEFMARYGVPQGDEARGQWRVCDDSTLRKMLAVGNMEGLYSNREAFLFIDSPNDRGSIATDLKRRGLLKDWFEFLADVIPTNPPDDPFELIRDVDRILSKHSTAFRSWDSYTDASRLSVAVMRQAGEEDRGEGLRRLVSECECFTFLTVFLDDLRSEHGDGYTAATGRIPQGRTIGDGEVIAAATAEWVCRIQQLATNPFRLMAEPGQLSILLRWQEFSEHGEEEVYAFTLDLIESDEGVWALVSAFPPGLSMNGLEKLFPITALEQVVTRLQETLAPEPDVVDRREEIIRHLEHHMNEGTANSAAEGQTQTTPSGGGNHAH